MQHSARGSTGDFTDAPPDLVIVSEYGANGRRGWRSSWVEGRIVAPPIIRIALDEVQAALNSSPKANANGKTVVIL